MDCCTCLKKGNADVVVESTLDKPVNSAYWVHLVIENKIKGSGRVTPTSLRVSGLRVAVKNEFYDKLKGVPSTQLLVFKHGGYDHKEAVQDNEYAKKCQPLAESAVLSGIGSGSEEDTAFVVVAPDEKGADAGDKKESFRVQTIFRAKNRSQNIMEETKHEDNYITNDDWERTTKQCSKAVKKILESIGFEATNVNRNHQKVDAGVLIVLTGCRDEVYEEIFDSLGKFGKHYFVFDCRSLGCCPSYGSFALDIAWKHYQDRFLSQGVLKRMAILHLPHFDDRDKDDEDFIHCGSLEYALKKDTSRVPDSEEQKWVNKMALSPLHNNDAAKKERTEMELATFISQYLCDSIFGPFLLKNEGIGLYAAGMVFEKEDEECIRLVDMGLSKPKNFLS